MTPGFVTLTPRELRVVLVATGKSNPEIAQSGFCRNRHGVANTLRNVFDKVGCSRRVELALWDLRCPLERCRA
jgi:DNA-binding CsgD family transcriptional regulator